MMIAQCTSTTRESQPDSRDVAAHGMQANLLRRTTASNAVQKGRVAINFDFAVLDAARLRSNLPEDPNEVLELFLARICWGRFDVKRLTHSTPRVRELRVVLDPN